MKNHYFQMDDRALWSELRSGSLIALEVIYRRYYSLLLNYGMNVLLMMIWFAIVFRSSL